MNLISTMDAAVCPCINPEMFCNIFKCYGWSPIEASSNTYLLDDIDTYKESIDM